MCFNHLSPLPIILQSSPSPHNHCPFYKRSISGGLNYAKELWMPTFKSQQDQKKKKKIHTPINLRLNLCTSSFKVQKAINQNFGTLQMKTSPAAGGHHQSWSISDDSLRRYVQYASESCIQELLMSASVSIPTVSEPNKLGNGGDGWKILTLENGVEISKRRTGSLHIFRSRWVLRSISPQQFITVANAIDAAKQWDSELVEARYIKDLEDNLSIIRLRFGDNSKPLFRKREFIVYERRETMEDGTLVVAVASLPKEIAAGLLPQQNNAIRGLLLQSGWVVEKLEDINSCIVTYVVQLDPAGWLPKWFVNRLNTKLVMIIENLRKLVQTTAPHSS